MGLFGLGAPEILVILGFTALAFGPETLKGWAKDAGKIAGELKDVPKEFNEALQSGGTSEETKILCSG